MSRYWSQRNTANRTHIWDDGSSASNLAERGPPGPRGLNGLNGIDGLDGAPGADGNADFMLLNAVGTGGNNLGITNFDYTIHGSTDMLADHRVIRCQGTSGSIYNGNHNVRTMSLLFKPGVYRFTVTGSPMMPGDTHAYGFDTDHNHLIGYQDITAEPYQPPQGGYYPGTTVRTYIITNNTNFYYVERTNVAFVTGNSRAPQLMFEKIGNVESSGSDDTLAGYTNLPIINTEIIDGGISWNQVYQPPPATHHPSTHPSNGGSNEWAVIELIAGGPYQQFGWIHRIKRFF
jgi:hypothetical protein